MSILSTGSRAALTACLGIAALVGLPSGVAAKTEHFYRFEEEATANWRMVETCGDGTTSTTLVTVIGGMEVESPDIDDVNEFVTVIIRNVLTCDGELVNEFGTGPADYTGSSSLQHARVSGTVTLRSGESAVIDVIWEGTGPLQTTVNHTHFPGFSGTFIGKQRDAVATGSVVVAGDGLVSGPSESGRIETLEDRNTTKV